MTIDINESESPDSPASAKKSVPVLKPVAAWILVLSLIATLLVFLVENRQVAPTRERPTQQGTITSDKRSRDGLKVEEMIPILSPHLGHSSHH